MTETASRAWVVLAILASPNTASAQIDEAWPSAAAVLSTPPLGQLEASRPPRADIADYLPADMEPWGLPFPIGADHPFDERRGAWFVLNRSGAGVWLLPVARPADLSAWMRARGARPLRGGRVDWHLPARAAAMEAACRAVEGALACQRPVGPRGPDALQSILDRWPGWPEAESEPPRRWVGRVRPPRLAAWVRRRLVERARHRARLLAPADQPAAMAAARRAAHRWSVRLGNVEVVFASWSASTSGARLTATMRFSDAAWSSLRRAIGRGPADPHLIGWSRTPALLQVWANLEPRIAREVLATWLGRAPAGLRGDFGVLWLGIRGACRHACADRTGDDARAWPSFFPTAAAFKVTEAGTDRALHDLGLATSTASRKRAELATRAGRTEIAFEDQTLFVASGAGLGSAASRRWADCDAVRPEAGAIAHAQADLHAIRAALEALDARTAPPAVSKLSKTLDAFSSSLGDRRWVVVDLEPMEPRSLRLVAETRP